MNNAATHENGERKLSDSDSGQAEAGPVVVALEEKQKSSNLFTIICSGFALISDGYQNNLMTMYVLYPLNMTDMIGQMYCSQENIQRHITVM
jgi:hypothetical protein